MSVPEPRAEAGGRERRLRRLFFYGQGGSLFGIHVVNILLTIVTLGVYYFWARVRVRAYLLSQSEFEGDRFAYHGTGKELLVGWLRAAVVLGVPIVLLLYGPQFASAPVAVEAAAFLLVYIIALVFVPVAVVAVRRYRLSRTSWRGIRFSFRGRTVDFMRIHLAGWLLTSITMGIYYPFFVARRQTFLVSHSHFGNERFRFDGRGDDLFSIYALGLLATLLVWPAALALASLVTGALLSPLLELSQAERWAWGGGLALVLGLPASLVAWFWFQARKQRYLWDHTGFATARFRSSLTTGPLLRLRLVNALLLIVTLGLAWPWLTVRNVRFAFRYLALEGLLDLASIQQEAEAVTAIGEGLAGFLDAGFDFG